MKKNKKNVHERYTLDVGFAVCESVELKQEEEQWRRRGARDTGIES